MALPHVQHVEEDPEQASPSALFVRSLLGYEAGEYGIAARGFEKAIAGLRRVDGRDLPLIDRARFFQAASLLAEGRPEEGTRALKLMQKALDTMLADGSYEKIAMEWIGSDIR